MRRIWTLMFALVLVLAACGDDSSSDDTAAATTMADSEHVDEAVHEEGDEHAEDEHAVDGMSEEYIPEASGDVEASHTIDMHDFGYDVSGLELMPGMTVEFVLVNEGLLIHEFRLTTEGRAAEHIAAGHVDHGEEGEDAHDEDRDIIVNVGPGETRTVVMTLPDEGEGFDQVACLIPGHYEAGMFLDI